MKSGAFIQQTSLTKRLKLFFFAFAIFFLVTSAAIYFASQNVLTGLTEINHTNEILESTNLALESLNLLTQNVNKLFEGKEIEDARFAYNVSLKQAKVLLNNAIQRESVLPATPRFLLSAYEGLRQYEAVLNDLFTEFPSDRVALTAKEEITLKKNLLVARQFELEIREAIRSAQIIRKNRSEDQFNEIYGMRYRPLIVGIGLALFFFIFVIFAGRSVTERLEKSMKNLSTATDAVARLDLSYRAPIIAQDEFGELTYEFNQMVSALEEGRARLRLTVERITRLQEITAAFSEALKPDEVWDVVVQQGFEATHALAGIVALVTEDGSSLEIKRMEGYSKENQIRERWNMISLTETVPFTDAINSREPIWLESGDEIKEKYPSLINEAGGSKQSLAAVPLIAGGRTFGVLGLSFSVDRKFSQDERLFIVALARQCAQALYRSRLYDDAQKAISTRDEFLSIASHELRTPLTPLKLQLQGFARQIQTGNYKELPRERLMKIVESADKQIGRLANLIEDLLDVSRINAGKLSLSREVLNLSDLVRDVLSRYENHLTNVKCTIETKIDNDVYGSMDRLRTEQVFVNLLTNAAKYAAGKKIKVSLEQRGTNAVLKVQDHGPGIAQQDQERVFDRFERVKARDNIGGLGLGLYISKQIVEAHGGKISVKSEPGKGATFIVNIPLKSAGMADRTEDPPPIARFA